MRKVFYLVLSLVIASCTSNNELQEKLAFIDVTEEYPEKKIELTDIAGVSYLHLNSKTDDYLYKGSIDYVTENNIIVIDRSQNSVLFFSKYKRQNKLFPFLKTFCARFCFINTKQNVHFALSDNMFF